MALNLQYQGIRLQLKLLPFDTEANPSVLEGNQSNEEVSEGGSTKEPRDCPRRWRVPTTAAATRGRAREGGGDAGSSSSSSPVTAECQDPLLPQVLRCRDPLLPQVRQQRGVQCSGGTGTGSRCGSWC
ncbi:unnamed protein product [Miscanthus lutarioriparius]|uniref:Uncharacterized protein n=1 Tax=Miscanthus lutarioriparius TaxID=422564 RepID=A0A811NX95_9POAL|nr:unnamed protein product [Miscanthus lutarioriparius]